MNNQKCHQTLFLNPLYIQELKLFISKVYSVYPLRIFLLFVQVYKPLMEILCCCNDTQIGWNPAWRTNKMYFTIMSGLNVNVSLAHLPGEGGGACSGYFVFAQILIENAESEIFVACQENGNIYFNLYFSYLKLFPLSPPPSISIFCIISFLLNDCNPFTPFDLFNTLSPPPGPPPTP